MGKSKADTGVGGTIGAIAGAAVAGPLGALVGGAIGGLIGGKNIAKGVMGAIQQTGEKYSRDTRLDSATREKWSNASEKAKNWSEKHRDW